MFLSKIEVLCMIQENLKQNMFLIKLAEKESVWKNEMCVIRESTVPPVDHLAKMLLLLLS